LRNHFCCWYCCGRCLSIFLVIESVLHLSVVPWSRTARWKNITSIYSNCWIGKCLSSARRLHNPHSKFKFSSVINNYIWNKFTEMSKFNHGAGGKIEFCRCRWYCRKLSWQVCIMRLWGIPSESWLTCQLVQRYYQILVPTI
jgi:hypothetical protein